MLTDNAIRAYMSDLAVWAAECYFILDEKGQPAPIILADHQQAILREIFSQGGDGRLKYTQALYSTIKKSGKSEILSLAALYSSQFIAPPHGEIYLFHSDEQAASERAFANIVRAIQFAPPGLYPGVKISSREIRFANGTTIRAMASHVSASGLQPSFLGFDELWSFTAPTFETFWDEASRTSPTRDSLLFVATYAGISNQSKILEKLWSLGEAGDPILGGLPCYANQDARLFAYIDQGAKARRMPWQLGGRGDQYYAAERATLRSSAFARQHRNEWTSGEQTFVDLADWQACIKPRRATVLAGRFPVVCGLDLAVRRDWAAFVVICRTHQGVEILDRFFWRPSKSKEIALMQIEETIIEASKRYRILNIFYDPYQAEMLCQRLRSQKIRCTPFPQHQGNLSKAASALYELISERRLIAFPDPDGFEEQIQNVSAIETPRGLRLSKQTSAGKIDLIAALSFAVAGLAISKVPPANPFGVSTSICKDRQWLEWGRCPLSKDAPMLSHAACEVHCDAFRKVLGWAMDSNTSGNTALSKVLTFSKEFRPLEDGGRQRWRAVRDAYESK